MSKVGQTILSKQELKGATDERKAFETKFRTFTKSSNPKGTRAAQLLMALLLEKSTQAPLPSNKCSRASAGRWRVEGVEKLLTRGEARWTGA